MKNRKGRVGRGTCALTSAWAVSMTAIVMAFVGNAHAFSGEFHTQITNQATKKFGFGPVSAQGVLRGVLDTDAPPAAAAVGQGEWFNDAAHFCDEVFAAGSARLRDKLELAVSSMAQGRKDLAMDAVGRALHGIQDFFAHSNFVAISPHASIDLLTLTDPSPSDRSKPVDCKTGKGPLTLAYWYYEGDDYAKGRVKKVPAPSNRCMHADLAKDTPSYPAGREQHEQAKKRALDLSIDFIQRVKAKLEKDYPGKALFDALVSDGDPCKAVFAAHPELANPARLVPRPAINWGNGKAFFFKGSQYIRYDLAKETPDPGYPKPIDAVNWPGLWTSGIDAAVRWGNNRAFFFKGNQYIRYTIKFDKFTGEDKSTPDAGYPLPIDEQNWPGLWGGKGIDAAVEWGPGGFFSGDAKAYFFRGAEYVRYNIPKNGGTPETQHTALTSRSWNGLCSNGLDGAINWGNGKAYLFKGNYYFRFDLKTDRVDPGYPKPVDAVNWPGL